MRIIDIHTLIGTLNFEDRLASVQVLRKKETKPRIFFVTKPKRYILNQSIANFSVTNRLHPTDDQNEVYSSSPAFSPVSRISQSTDNPR